MHILPTTKDKRRKKSIDSSIERERERQAERWEGVKNSLKFVIYLISWDHKKWSKITNLVFDYYYNKIIIIIIIILTDEDE